jgi:hypothetical protein
MILEARPEGPAIRMLDEGYHERMTLLLEHGIAKIVLCANDGSAGFAAAGLPEGGSCTLYDQRGAPALELNVESDGDGQVVLYRAKDGGVDRQDRPIVHRTKPN